MLLCVLASRLCERFTCRTVNGFGLVIASAAFASSSFCTSVYILYFTYSILFGTGLALCFTANSIAVRHYFNKRYSLATGIISAASGLGTLIAGPIIQPLTDTFGWQNAYRMFSGIFVFLLFFIFIVDPNVEEPSNSHSMNNNSDKNNKLQVDSAEPVSLVTIPRRIVLGFIDISVWTFSEYVIMVVAVVVVSFGHYTALIHMVSTEYTSVSNTNITTVN